MDIVFQIILFAIGYFITLCTGAVLEEEKYAAAWVGLFISLPLLAIAAFGFSQ